MGRIPKRATLGTFRDFCWPSVADTHDYPGPAVGYRAVDGLQSIQDATWGDVHNTYAFNDELFPVSPCFGHNAGSPSYVGGVDAVCGKIAVKVC